MPTYPGTCEGLVAVTAAISINLDAVREELICLRQRFGEALPTREYWQIRDELFVTAIAKQTELLARAILQLAAAVGKTDFPDLGNSTFTTPSALDLGDFLECFSQYYCPPGFAKNESGVCVEIEEEG